MKKYLFTLIFIVSLLNTPAWGQADYKHLYERKARSFAKMRNAGTTLAIIGGSFTAAGTALMLTLPKIDANDDDQSSKEDLAFLQITGGMVLAAVGIEMFIGGIVLGSIGSRKHKIYKRRLDNLSFNIIYSSKQQGLLLTYRF